MSYRVVILQTLVIAIVLFGVGLISASAQGRQSGYRSPYSPPYGPTISPALDLFRRDFGSLSPYHTYVRPQQQLAAIQTQQAQLIDWQRDQISNLESRVESITTGNTDAAATGTAASFRNYSRFYPRK